MEENRFVKDIKPYLIYSCSNQKCAQFFYVKKEQETKKCPRCRRINTLDKDSGELVEGITAALEKVKQRQNEFALNKLGSEPDFSAANDFSIKTNVCKIEKKKKSVGEKEDNNYFELKEILKELSDEFQSFPEYAIEMKAERIPKKLINRYINALIREKFLIKMPGNYFRLSKLSTG